MFDWVLNTPLISLPLPVVSELRSKTKGSRFEWRLLAMCRGEPSAVIARLMSKSPWSGRKWQRGVKEAASPFPWCPVNRECLWKKYPDRKKEDIAPPITESGKLNYSQREKIFLRKCFSRIHWLLQYVYYQISL